MLNVPCGRKGQIFNEKMSYLKLKLNNTKFRTASKATADKQAIIALDYSISILIARLGIYDGSNLLGPMHEYGLPHTLWTNITGCADAHITTGNVLEGMGTTARVGEGITMGGYRYYAIPLISRIIGCMQSTYFLTTGDMSSDDLWV